MKGVADQIQKTRYSTKRAWANEQIELTRLSGAIDYLLKAEVKISTPPITAFGSSDVSRSNNDDFMLFFWMYYWLLSSSHDSTQFNQNVERAFFCNEKPELALAQIDRAQASSMDQVPQIEVPADRTQWDVQPTGDNFGGMAATDWGTGGYGGGGDYGGGNDGYSGGTDSGGGSYGGGGDF
jgi:uncharacterized membrane protein YgcG